MNAPEEIFRTFKKLSETNSAREMKNKKRMYHENYAFILIRVGSVAGNLRLTLKKGAY